MKTTRQLFEQDGFVIHPSPVLAPDVLKRAAQGLAQVSEGRTDTGEAAHECRWKPGDDPHQLRKIEQPQLASAALREAIGSLQLGEIAAQATGAREVQVWWVQGLYKPGTPQGTSAGNVGWHQDESYWGEWEVGSELFTAWLALSDVTPQAGPMVFVPGSHRWGLLQGGDFFSQDQEALRFAIQLPEGQSWREVMDVLPPGGVSLHHRRLLHGSHQNTSNAPRLSLAIHLKTENARIRPDSGFARYLERPEICPVIFTG